jgi:drug/metabolite transporter (DMT)-like permease
MGYLSLALASAVLLGVWKFGLGMYRDRVTVWSVILISASAAAVMYVVLGTLSGDLAFDPDEVGEGLLGGALNLAGTYLLLKAFTHGKLGVASGIAATNVLVPLTYSIISGEGFTSTDVAGIVLIMAGLATFYVPHMRSRHEETLANSRDFTLVVVLALASALFWGLAIVVLDLGTKVSVTGTLATSQVPQIIVSLGIVLWAVRRNLAGVTTRALTVLIGSGIALSLANIAFYTAANEGNLGIVSILAALSPMVTALLAVAFCKETLTRIELLALIIVVAGACFVVA